MSATPEASVANQQIVAQAGALEWVYPPGTNINTGDDRFTGLPVIPTGTTVVCRVYRNPGVRNYTRLINDAGPIWGVQVFKRPPLSSSRTKGVLSVEWPVEGNSADDEYIDDTEADTDAKKRAKYDERLGKYYFENRDAASGQQKLDDSIARHAVCWDFDEAIKTAAHLAVFPTD